MGGWLIYERRRKEIRDIRALYNFFISSNFKVDSKGQLGKLFIKLYSSEDLKQFNKDFIDSVKLLNNFVLNRGHEKIKGYYELEGINPQIHKVVSMWTDFINKLKDVAADITFDEYSLIVFELFSSYFKAFNTLVRRARGSKNSWKVLLVFFVLALIGGLSAYFIFWA